MKNIMYFAISFVLVLIILLTIIFYNSKKEYGSEYNFVITKIELDSKGYLIFYNNKKEYMFANYLFTNHDSISIGDKIIKKANSKLMYIYRKDILTGKYELYYVKKANGNFH